mgnify:CR=1 FL=1
MCVCVCVCGCELLCACGERKALSGGRGFDCVCVVAVVRMLVACPAASVSTFSLRTGNAAPNPPTWRIRL